jgi:hypothetical protein
MFEAGLVFNFSLSKGFAPHDVLGTITYCAHVSLARKMHFTLFLSAA